MKKGISTFLAVSLTVVIMLALAAGGYYYLDKKQQQDTDKLQAQIDDLAAKSKGNIASDNSDSSESSSTTDIYTSELGYSIEYPSSWAIKTGIPNSVTINSPENEAIYQQISANPENHDDWYIEDISITYYKDIATLNSDWGTSAKNLSEWMNDMSKFENTNTSTLAGETAYEATEGGMDSYYTIATEHNGHIYKILMGNRSRKADLSAKELAAISSFRFTD